ncbi:MAG: PhzF family phenazine biosynthesis protein [Myxococcota bacterium]
MRSVSFQVLNVFAEARFAGNPLAVIEDASGLREDELMPICQQFNLSETTFIYPPEAGGVAKVRIFSPDGEMAFAGHPTLGTAHVLRELEAMGDAFSIELKAGLIPVRAEGDLWELQANAGTSREAPSAEAIAKLLHLSEAAIGEGARWVSTGTEQLLVPIRDLVALRAAHPDFDGLSSVGTNRAGRANVSLFLVEGQRVTSRYFWLHHREVREDPGTGSAAANLGAWLVERGVQGPATWTIEQGHQTGRLNHLRLRIDGERRVFVAGRVIPLMRGTISLSS